MSAPPDDLYRVDVSGYSVFVKGEAAKNYLEQINHCMAIMKMALHQVSRRHPGEDTTGWLARVGLMEES